MNQPLKVGIIGDYDPNSLSHVPTNEALGHAAAALSVSVHSSWIPTRALANGFDEKTLKQFDALWCAPGSPYKSMDGALRGIQFAREDGWPFIATGGGFQHALVEYARNVLGIHDAEHEETSPGAPTLLISRLSCSLVGKTQTIKIVPGSHAHRAYLREEVTEQFYCNYGLNPDFRDRLDDGHLKVTGIDLNGEARIVELSGHPFYVATLFVPQMSSGPERPHPLIIAYLRAALAFQTSRRNSEERGHKF